MIIKKFTGKTEEEAVEAAKKELGSGAVIMNVKSVKRKGLAGLFGVKQMEVTAALEEENEVQRGGQNSTARAALRPGRTENIIAPQAAVDVMSESSQNIERKLDNLQQLLLNRFQQSEAEIRGALGTEGQEMETKPVQEEIPEEKEETSEQERFIRLLYNTMLESEVDEKYANQIVDDFDRANKPDLPIDYILSDVYQKMILKFGKAEGITPAENGPRIVLFMGPTGVGKTTTIAKIASKLKLNKNADIALITADTYRIAAVEQLKTYANILSVPLKVIYSPGELSELVEEMQQYEYCLVDTAGRSHKNKEQIEDIRSLIEQIPIADRQVFLVLNAGAKYSDLLEIADVYAALTDYSIIFTKLDETSAAGAMMNIHVRTKCPLSYVTTGQNVPDDISEVNPQKVAKQLLGGSAKNG